ncbi:MAG: hypothetical protein KatS3mg121_0463 [Gammaproteobacteria bacterium]|nr:MAG: hypothetical protein KatS3mg121_0463 [Gammaproteobacteria bacterium]
MVVGLIEDADGRVLITRRPEGVHQGGKWEFPGGKRHVDESAWAALRRELAEELGVRVTAAHPWWRIHHDYPERSVLLDVWRVRAYQGRPRGAEGQALAWRAPAALDPADFPPADRGILRALQLPPRALVTPPCPRGEEPRWLAALAAAVAGGVGLVVLRDHARDRAAYLALAAEAAPLCREAGARLLLNMPVDWWRPGLADGLHLTAARLAAATARPLPDPVWLSAACHDAAALARAAALGCDLAFVSPVCATASHPGAVPLGWAGLQASCRHTSIPVYALGGVGPADLPRARVHGAHGVAGIRAFWPATLGRSDAAAPGA